MRVADTSAIYALFDEADAHHRSAAAQFGNPNPILVPREILIESIDLISYRRGWKRASAVLEAFLRLEHVELAKSVEIDAVRRLFAEAAGSLSLADAVVVQTCRAYGADPFTFDGAIQDACRR